MFRDKVFPGLDITLKPAWYRIAAGFAMVLMTVIPNSSVAGAPSGQKEKIPVIFDTDICDDIDDTWALILLLQSPEFDVRLITTEIGNTEAKAQVVAKILDIAERTDIPIGIGVQHHNREHRQTPWAKDYDLESYPGRIYRDGVQAVIDIIMKSKEPVKIIAVGPVPNIGAALEREPAIAKKAQFVGMHGSIRRGYDGSSNISAEYNVKAHPKAAQKVFTADWEITITPLDTCGIVHLAGDKYQKLFRCDKPLAKALIDNYRVWYGRGIQGRDKLSEAELKKRVDGKVNSSSTTLYDTVAIYLAISTGFPEREFIPQVRVRLGTPTELVTMEKLPVRITDDGYTRIDETAKIINCATEWKDMGAFEDWLLERLTR